MAPDEFDKIFEDNTNVNPANHDSSVLDDSLLTNLAFKIPRQKVDALRRSLLNIVPHYFNIHNGTITLLHFILPTPICQVAVLGVSIGRQVHRHIRVCPNLLESSLWTPSAVCIVIQSQKLRFLLLCLLMS